MSKDKAHGGTILNIGSSCSMKPFLTSPIYSATKHAVLGLTKAYGVNILKLNLTNYLWKIKLEVGVDDNFEKNDKNKMLSLGIEPRLFRV